MTLRPGRARSALVALALLACFLGPAPSQASDDDFRWVLPPAEALRNVADGIERARDLGDDRSLEEGVLRFADLLVRGVPDGAFALSDERWIGPGAYFEEILFLADESTRERWVEKIDLVLAARLRDRETEEGRALAEALDERLDRDFPFSSLAGPIRERRAARLLESGDVDTFLDLRGDAIPEPLVERLRATTVEPLTPAVEYPSPLALASDATWPAPRGARPTPPTGREVGAAGTHRWAAAVESRRPALDRTRTYWQSSREVRRVDSETGEIVWRSPIFEPPGSVLPGTRLQPTVVGTRVIAAARTKIFALDHHTASPIWERSFRDFVPPIITPAAEEGEPDEATPVLDRDILAVSPPVTGPFGVVFTLLVLRNGYVEGHLVRLDLDGNTRWTRPLGSAAGATYLGLGSAQPLVAVHGARAYVLPQRGALIAAELTDGAIAWGVEYSSFDARGSTDALRFREQRWSSTLAAGPLGVLAAPADSGSSFLWSREGSLRAELPMPGARWVAAAQPSDRGWTLLAANDRHATEWRITGETLDSTEWSLAPGRPSLTGVPVFHGGEWWAPHQNGLYRWKPDASGAAPRSHRLALPFEPRVVSPSAAGVWIDGDHRSAWAAPLEPDTFEGDSLVARLSRLRRDLLELRATVILEELRALSTLLPGQQESDIVSAADGLADALIRVLRDQPNRWPTAEQRALRLEAVRLITEPLRASRVAFEEARRLARAHDADAAIEMAYASLEASPRAMIEVRYQFETTSELAVRRLLLELRQKHAASPVFADRSQAAASPLAEAMRTSNLDRLRNVGERYPFTPEGRRAWIELARAYYGRGARVQALWSLERLVLLEPETPEGLRARFEIAALEVEQERVSAARHQLEILRDQYGSLELTSRAGTETVSARATRRLAELPKTQRPDKPRPSVAVDYRPIWRTRTELDHQRTVHVDAVSDAPHLQLTTSRRRLALRDSRTGTDLWVQTYRRPANSYTPTRRLWADELGIFNEPIQVGNGLVVLTDREHLYGIDLESGAVLWLERPDPLIGPPGGAPDPDAPPTMIERTVSGLGVCVITANDGYFYAFRTSDGSRLWKERIPGPLVGDPHVRDGQLVCTYHVPAQLEVRNLLDGSVARTIHFERGSDPISDRVGPWFVADGVAVLPRERSVRALDLRTGGSPWSLDLPGILAEVHQFDDLPFFVLEVEQLTRGPVLLGIARETGQLLWRRGLGSSRRTIQTIEYHEGQLYVLETSTSTRRIICLEVPVAFRQVEGLDLLPQAELDIRWTQTLGRQWDSFQLVPYRDWLLVTAEFQCTLTVLDRDSGLVLRGGPFRLAQEFLAERKLLHHASFVEDTLVFVTQYGSAGLRRRTPIEAITDQWKVLLELDPTTGPDAPNPATLLSAALSAYRDGQTVRACRILETALSQPGLTSRTRRQLTLQLEGFSQDLGERKPLEITVGRLARPPAIDGALDEPWNAQSGVVLDGARFYHPVQGPNEDGSAWRGWRDLSVVMFTGWSDTGFHLALDVTDDSIHPYDRDAEQWLGDCLLMAFDFRGDGGLRPKGDDQLLTLALTVPPPPPPPPPAGEDPEDEPEESEDEVTRPSGEFQVNRKADGSGVIYEVMIPWETFRDARGEPPFPYPGTRFGLNIVLTDDDNGSGARSYFSLSPGQMLRQSSENPWEVFVPEYFPQLIIGP